MSLGDLNHKHHGSKSWFAEVARRIAQYEQQQQKEVATPTAIYQAPISTRDSARLTQGAFALKQHYNRRKK